MTTPHAMTTTKSTTTTTTRTTTGSCQHGHNLVYCYLSSSLLQRFCRNSATVALQLKSGLGEESMRLLPSCTSFAGSINHLRHRHRPRDHVMSAVMRMLTVFPCQKCVKTATVMIPTVTRMTAGACQIRTTTQRKDFVTRALPLVDPFLSPHFVALEGTCGSCFQEGPCLREAENRGFAQRQRSPALRALRCDLAEGESSFVSVAIQGSY